MHRTGRPLEFDDVLITGLRRKPRARRQSRHVVWLTGVLFLAASSALMMGVLSRHPSWFTNDKPALTNMAGVFLQGLQTGNFDTTLSVCAEGPQAAALVQRESATVLRTALKAGAAEDAVAISREQREAEFVALRDAFSGMGVVWNDVRPLAVGALRSKMRDPDLMSDAITAVLGNVYFQSAGKVFAVEVTAWRCGDTYVIVDIWRPHAVELNGMSLQDAADSELEVMHARSESSAPGLDFSRPKSIFVEL